jgi:hypothetical protein
MSSAGYSTKRPIDSLSTVALFALHAWVAMVVGSLVFVMAAVIANPFLKDAPRLKSAVDWDGFLNPIAWIPGIVFGLFVNRLLKPGRVACWVWIVGLAWMTAGIWDSVRRYDARYTQGCSIVQNVVNDFVILDTQQCGGGESPLAGLVFTLPAISSTGYAIGAWLALRLERRRSDQK